MDAGRPPDSGPADRRDPVTDAERWLDVSRLEPVLERWIPDAADRRFVARILVEGGPIHHRGATFALLRLLDAVLTRAGVRGPATLGEALPIRMHLHPYVRAPHDVEQTFPLGVPTGPVARAVGPDPRAVEALTACLASGPPHHALANACLVAGLGDLLDALGRSGG